MNIYCEGTDLIIDEIYDFDIEDVLECGQCFHFAKLDEKQYELLAKGKYLRVYQKSNRLILKDTTMEDYNVIWRSYFDLDTNYSEIKDKILLIDDRLRQAVMEKNGIRIIKQDFFECLISFIISQNKQIPHIKQIVHTLSERYGTKLSTKNGDKYLFPTVEQLINVSEDELRECKVGFRAPYIRDAVLKVYNHEIDGEKLKALSADEAKNILVSIKGVGEKVASCVLLFSLGKTEAFPVDVWMKRIMEYMYFHEDTKKEVIESFAKEKYGPLSGYAQQYLFCYGREIGLGK